MSFIKTYKEFLTEKNSTVVPPATKLVATRWVDDQMNTGNMEKLCYMLKIDYAKVSSLPLDELEKRQDEIRNMAIEYVCDNPEVLAYGERENGPIPKKTGDGIPRVQNIGGKYQN